MKNKEILKKIFNALDDFENDSQYSEKDFCHFLSKMEKEYRANKKKSNAKKKKRDKEIKAIRANAKIALERLQMERAARELVFPLPPVPPPCRICKDN